MLSLYTPVAGICWDQRLSILPPQLLPLSPVPERLSLTYAALMAELQEAARMGMHPHGHHSQSSAPHRKLPHLPCQRTQPLGQLRQMSVALLIALLALHHLLFLLALGQHRPQRGRRKLHRVGELTRLEAIEVSGVENERNTLLKSLPASLGQLGSLKQLTLVRLDGLEVLPDAVVRLTVLGSLTIESSGKCAAEGTRQAGCAQAAHAWGVV